MMNQNDKTKQSRPNRMSADKLNQSQRYTVMKTLKQLAIEGDLQAIIAIGLFETSESLRKLHDAGVRL